MHAFAEGERVYFLRNDRNLGVKNGSLGTIEHLRDGKMVVALDAEGGPGRAQQLRRVSFDTQQYAALDYGYAATVHKAQGVTVERAYVLGSELYDRNVTNVAMTRHREGAELFLSRETAPDKETAFAAMGRERPKDMVLDYDQAARDNDRMRRETAAHMEEQRRAREAACAERQAPKSPTHAEMLEKAQDKEGREVRMAHYRKLEDSHASALRESSKGRTTPEEIWRKLPEVASAEHRIQHAKYVVGEYRRQLDSFEGEHPYKAAMGLSPKVYDRYGNGGEMRLSQHFAAGEVRLHKHDVAWAKLCGRDDPHSKARATARAHNDCVDAATKKLPGIEKAMQEAAAQHKLDLGERSREFEMERELSRSLDRGLGFER